jgi:hypothetical protein
MAAKQTRRSVSMSRAVYDSLKSYCLKHDRSMSFVVESALRSFFVKADGEKETVHTSEALGSVVVADETSEEEVSEEEVSEDEEVEVSEEKDLEDFSVPVRVPIGLPEKGRPLPSKPAKKRPPGNITSF